MTELEHLGHSLKHRLSLPLPGLDAQLKMAHAERRMKIPFRVPADARPGAVLVLLYSREEEIGIPLIRREAGGGVHSGQISFPGGQPEAADEGLAHTALREAQEEINVSADRVEVVGQLTPLYIPPSNFMVYPFVGVTAEEPLFIPQPGEVAEVLTLPLRSLLSGEILSERTLTLSNGLVRRMPCFELEGHAVWGATAMMLSELKALLLEISA
jgi:8-oxo-dGTP pyrophosphatase MutT (NUDIX family)